MRNPELREKYGASLRGGLLLYGPPGCGKTYLARAVAGELGARFIAVGLSDVLSRWMGESESNIAGLFAYARAQAPCVLFFDEIDALGRSRSGLGRSASALRGVINQLLAELDGVASQNEGVFVLGATNAPWDVDGALRRPGRFDRAVFVEPPDAAARVEILATHLKGLPVDPTVDTARLAARTEGFSGADLAHVCRTAAQSALVDAARTGASDRAITHGRPRVGHHGHHPVDRPVVRLRAQRGPVRRPGGGVRGTWRLHEGPPASVSADPYSLPEALVAAQRWDAARAALGEALAASPDDPRLLGLLVRTLRAQGSRQEALDASQRMLAISPQDPYALRLATLVLLDVGWVDEAIGLAVRAVEVDPGNAANHLALSRAWAESARPEALGSSAGGCARGGCAGTEQHRCPVADRRGPGGRGRHRCRPSVLPRGPATGSRATPRP